MTFIQISTDVTMTFRTILSLEPRKTHFMRTHARGILFIFAPMFASNVVIQDGRFMYVLRTLLKCVASFACTRCSQSRGRNNLRT